MSIDQGNMTVKQRADAIAEVLADEFRESANQFSKEEIPQGGSTVTYHHNNVYGYRRTTLKWEDEQDYITIDIRVERQ